MDFLISYLLLHSPIFFFCTMYFYLKAGDTMVIMMMMKYNKMTIMLPWLVDSVDNCSVCFRIYFDHLSARNDCSSIFLGCESRNMAQM